MDLTRILLDTSAYSAFKRGLPQMRHRISEASTIFLSPVVLGELRTGFLRGGKLAANLEDLEKFLASPRVEVLVIDEESSVRYALIFDFLKRAGTPIPINDVWIAASAMQAGAVLLTTDNHFRQVPQIACEVLAAS
jgi:tRNA(fMet)-specific endonuclease VapC